MTKFLYLVLLAAVVWGVRGYKDDHDEDLIPDTNENNREIKCGKYYAQYPNFEDCSTYIVCQNGRKTIKSCPSGQHYNDRTIRCEEPCDAYCNKTLSCECKWSTCGLDDVCFLPQIVGGCRDRTPRFYFNKRTGECERFGYSGCRGNENNFQTKDECEQKCKKSEEESCPAGEKWSPCGAGCQKTCDKKDEEPCIRMCEPGCICKEEDHVRGPDGKCIPSDECKADSESTWFHCLKRNGLFPYPNNCRAFFQCYNFRPALRLCPPGRHFSFSSQRCERPCDAYCAKNLACRCKWPTCGLDDRCSLLPETGPCRAGFRNYYFNGTSGQCEIFIYGGCHGNPNNFLKKEDCERACPAKKEEECPSGEVWNDCKPCEKTCDNVDEGGKCDKKCEPGCVCDEPGTVRGPDGTCIAPPLCPEKPKPKPKPIPGFRCPSLKEGLYPNEDNCRTYFQCSNGDPSLRACPSGLHYSYQTQRCEQPCDAHCDKSLACECKWPTCGLPDRCSLLPEVGPCRAGFYPFYFNRSTGECEKFLYGGCRGNENNFKTKDECEKTCSKGEEESCPAGEKWSPCGAGCQKTCDKKDEEPCIRMCEAGCICKEEDHVRGPDGKCIPSDECKGDEKSCPSGEERKDCKPCEKTCDNVGEEQPCTKDCEPGCVCDDPGTVRGPDGTCIAPSLCPDKPKPNPSFHCPSLKEGLYPNEDNCTTFFQCSNGDPSLMSCPSGLHYSYQTQRCEQPCDAHCNKTLACKCKWYTCGLPDRCSLLPEVGPCRAGFYPFYFNRSTGICEKFLYGGCKGNENNFKTKDECEKTCSKDEEKKCPPGAVWSECGAGFQKTCENVGKDELCDKSCASGCVCEEPGHVKDSEGNCVAPPTCQSSEGKPIPRLNCDALKDGLYPNENNCTTFFACSNGEPSLMNCPSGLHYSYQTQRCEQPCDAHCNKTLACKCKWPTCGLPDRCSLLPDVGPCKINVRSFYFNRSTGECEKFVYGGCKGNENNFKTKDECKKTCSKEQGKRCPTGEIWSECGAGCQKTCENVEEEFHCKSSCEPGCVCKEPGHVKDSDGNCVDPSTCTSTEGPNKLCYKPSEPGPCKGEFPRFYFNKSSGKCENFTYGGCQGNENNFHTKIDCENICEKSLEICKLPPKTGVCKGKFTRYYFDPKSRKCETFVYGGCKGNRNNFITLKECQDSCLKKTHMKSSPLLGCVPANDTWGNVEDCSTYFYCKGDNYETELVHCPNGKHYSPSLKRCMPPCDAYCEPSIACECKWPTCKKAPSTLSPCNLPADKGPCKGSILRWFYNPSLRSCGRFMYGGCKGNGNNFMLERDCLATCKGKFHNSVENCRLPPERGPCDGHIEKYYFNHKEGECQKFVYGGCEGNQNNFNSQQECEISCLMHHAALDNCRTNSDCSNGKICRSNVKGVKNCVEGCSNTSCGKNAKCSVNSHSVVCSCPPDFSGDPFDKKVGCKPRRKSAEPECAEDGLRSDFESCRRYIRCSSGEKETVYCPPGLHYNEANQQCDSPCDARCDMSLAMECGWPVSAAEFECPSPDGKFPYPDNDRKYIRCRNNISSIEECEEDQRFDSREKECV